jgi:hypothetical protein
MAMAGMDVKGSLPDEVATHLYSFLSRIHEQPIQDWVAGKAKNILLR